jgi:hypothetical protein
MQQTVNYQGATLPPYLWMGEWGCLVGPFHKQEMVQFFLDNVLEASEERRPQLIRNADQWFIDTRMAEPASS